MAKVTVTAAENYLMLTMCQPFPEYWFHVKIQET